MKNSIEDLKTLRNWILGVATFATSISTFLVQALHFRLEPTLLVVLAFSILIIVIVFLINRVEKRQEEKLESHIKHSETNTTKLNNRLDFIDKVLLDIQRSTLRTEMNNEIARHPENHDTILRMAQRYFLPVEAGGLGANWVQADLFLSWAEKENAKGRPVHIPVDLSQAVAKEKTNPKK